VENEIHICPICKGALSAVSMMRRGSIAKIDCFNCGSYYLADQYHLDYIGNRSLNPAELATLSFAIRRMQSSGQPPLLVQDMAEDILRTTNLPTAQEQINNFVLYLGQQSEEPGVEINWSSKNIRAVLGCITEDASEWILSQAIERSLIKSRQLPRELAKVSLTIGGWERFQEIQTKVADTKKAFMAMKFGVPEMDRVFFECLKPAAKRAGYELMKLDDMPRAGLIDDRLRLEIRTARFLIADLSHQNAGAYWEAGFAEGLGRPVIYTCKQSVFNDVSTKPHFDTNHYLSILWDMSDLSKAAEQLTTTIRITLPTEAKLLDD
jgi:hypothetical protein